MTFAAGATLAGGRYVLGQQRGRGGMAVVWRAQDTQLERPVAIKVIAEALAADPDFRRRFEREARAAAAVSHPHVVKLFDYGLEDDQPYLVMEYVDGPNLAELAKEGGARRLDVEQVAHDLLEAVCHIHRAGVLHRDIKPANLLTTADGALRVTDFGIARLDETTQITRAGMVVGTERYLAPEVAAGGPASPASDLYSCGAVLAELMNERPASARLRLLVEALRAADPAARPRSAEAALDLLRSGGAAADDTAPLPATAATERLGATGELPGATAPAAAPGSASPSDRTVPVTAATPPTGPTAVIQPAGGGRSRRRAPAARDSSRGRHAFARLAGRWPLVAALAAALAAAALIASLAGDDGSERSAIPTPAPETAPAGEQINRLEEIVRRIGEHQRP